MSEYPSCKTCACFFRTRPNARDGQCRARSPVPIVIGVAATPALPGLVGGKNGMPQPIVNGFFPPVNENIWCMDWQPLADETVSEAAAQSGETA